MTNAQTIPWGKTQIRFLPRSLGETDVRAAAQLVSPSFDNLQDSFVALDQSNGHVIAVIPAKPKNKTFTVPTQGIGLKEALRQTLEKAANFLKGRV